jgi:hypothetical protein
MPLLLAFAAATAAPSGHVLVKAFDVSLGTPAGDLRKRGFRPNEFSSENSWVRTDDAFFDRVTVDISSSLPLVESVSASKRYDSGDRSQKQEACEADLASVAATLRVKYPSLRKPAWLKNENGMGGMLGYYQKRVFEEPGLRDADPSPGRTVSLTCIGPSVLPRPGDENRQTMLLVSYRISELERVPIERAFRAAQQAQERARARAIGVDPGKL